MNTTISTISKAGSKILKVVPGDDNQPHRVSDYEWKKKLFKFRATLHHGLPGNISAIAYDPIQKLLAVGTAAGLVKIFGKPSVEVVVNQYEGSISHLLFIGNSGKLLIVHKGSSTCELVNLDTKRALGTYIFNGTEVTTLSQVADTSFVFVGLLNGNIHVLNTATKLAISTYKISARTQLSLRQGAAVSAVVISPVNPNMLLICHELESIVEWDIDREDVINKYQHPDNCGTLNTATWHPSGNKFIAGFKNGELYVWKRNREKPVKVYRMTNFPNKPKRPIKRVFWSTLQGKSFLAVLGGTSVSNELATGVVRYCKKLNVLPIDEKKGTSGGELMKNIVDIIVCYPSHYISSINPTSIIAISSTSDILIFSPLKDASFISIHSPPSLNLQFSKITTTLFSNVSKAFLHDLQEYGDISWSPFNWPILGGMTSLQPLSYPNILVTGHEDGSVYFWDMSNTHFNLLYYLHVDDFIHHLNSSSIKSKKIQALDLCISSRVLTFSCQSGETFIFDFSNEPKPSSVPYKHSSIHKKTIERVKNALIHPENQVLLTEQSPNLARSQPVVLSVPNSAPGSSYSPSNSASQPIKTKKKSSSSSSSSSGEKSKKKRERRERSTQSDRESNEEANSSPSNASTSSVTVVGTFSWEKFFLNANVDGSAAKKYANYFVSEKITEDLIKDLDQDLMEMAGITTIGDKMRIMKYIKSTSNYIELSTVFPSSSSSPSSSNPSLPSSASAPSLTPSSGGEKREKSKRTHHHHRKKREEEGGASVGSPSEPSSSSFSQRSVSESSSQPASSSFSLNIPNLPSFESYELPEYENPYGKMVPPGFQLSVATHFPSLITQIRIASSLSKIAVGDKKGTVALIDISTGRILLHKSVAGDVESPVTWFAFDDKAIVHKYAPSASLPNIEKKKKKKKVTSIEAGLFVGLEDGRIFYIALKTGQIDRITRNKSEQGFEESEETLSAIILVNNNGSPVIPPSIEWESIMKSKKEQEEKEKQLSNSTDLVIRNLDEELKQKAAREIAEKHQKTAENEAIDENDRKFMIVCSGNEISIYSLPSYKLYSRYTCRENPEMANIIERDNGNFCLLVFLSSGDLQILTLLDLQEIILIPKALQSIGIQFVPSHLKYDVNCTSDGRFVVLSKYQEVIRGSLFFDENLLGLPYSLPKLFVPNVPLPDSETQFAALYNQMNYNTLFGNCKVQETKSETSAAVSGAQPQRVASMNDRSAASQQTSRAPAVINMLQQQPQQVKQHQSLGGKVIGTAGNAVNDVKEIMAQNFNALALRKEKLEELLVNTDEMATRASAFASIAEQLADKEKKRRW